MAGSAKINKWLEIAVIVVAILAPTVATVYCLKLITGTEFPPYYAVSRLIKAGSYSQIYDANAMQNAEQFLALQSAHGHSIFIAPPIISWAFYPLSFLHFKQALYLWTFILAISAVMSVLILCRILGLRGAKRAWLAVLLGTMGPFVLSLGKGYLIPILLLALVGLFANLKKRNFLLASLYQSLCWLQPQLILPLLCFELGIGQIYTVIITSLLAIIGLLLSFLIGGVGIIRSWYQLFSQQMNDWPACLADCTLQGQLLRFTVHRDLANQIAIASYFVLLIAVFIIGKRVKTKQWQLSILLTAVIPLSLVFFLRSSNQNLLLLFPGIVSLILMPINSWLKYVRALLIMVTLAILLLPLDMLFSCYMTERSVYNPFFWLIVIFAICALLIEKYVNGQNASADI
jgi:hypothetical protein